MKKADRNRKPLAAGRRPDYPYARWLDGDINELYAPEDFDRDRMTAVVRAVNAMARRKDWCVVCRAYFPLDGKPHIQVWGDMHRSIDQGVPSDILEWFVERGYRPNRGRPKKGESDNL